MKTALFSECGKYAIIPNEKTGRYDVEVYRVFVYSSVIRADCEFFCGNAVMITEEEKYNREVEAERIESEKARAAEKALEEIKNSEIAVDRMVAVAD